MIDRQLAARIETAALWAWPPRETASVEGWLLRAADGHTRRANSVRSSPFGAGAEVERAIGKVEAWYAARGLPTCFQLNPLTEPPGLDELLATRGYVRRSPSLVLLIAAAGQAGESARVELETRPTPLVMNALCDRLWGPRVRAARAALFSRIRRPHVFAVATAGGEPAAGALCVLDRELAGLFALRTQSPFQRQGHARAVVRRLLAWAHGLGARQIYLQVEEPNAPARALFSGSGGELAYRYWYRERAPAG